MGVKTVEPISLKTEILILGAGPAGLTAGLYSARAGRKTIILEGRGRSRLASGYRVENYPGFLGIDSLELRAKFRQQAEHFGAQILAEEAIDFSLSTDPKYAVSRDHLIEAQAVIFATGKPFTKERMIPGEERLVGAGISYCSTCDGPLYRGQKVVAYGSGQEAAEDVLALKQMGVEVTWVLGRENELALPAPLGHELLGSGIPIRAKTAVSRIEGEVRLEKVILSREGGEEEIMASALFIFRDAPTAPFLAKAGLELDQKQCLLVDRFQRTNIEGVFAAGDVTCGGMQIVSAAGEGAVAAMQAIAFIRKKADRNGGQPSKKEP